MKKLKAAFSENHKTIADLTPAQALTLAEIAFKGCCAEWKIIRSDKSGYWMNGTDRLGILHYCRINEYFEFHCSSTYPPNKDETEPHKITHSISTIWASWEHGLPYIQIVGWFLENGFNIFDRYPKTFKY